MLLYDCRHEFGAEKGKNVKIARALYGLKKQWSCMAHSSS